MSDIKIEILDNQRDGLFGLFKEGLEMVLNLNPGEDAQHNLGIDDKTAILHIDKKYLLSVDEMNINLKIPKNELNEFSKILNILSSLIDDKIKLTDEEAVINARKRVL